MEVKDDVTGLVGRGGGEGAEARLAVWDTFYAHHIDTLLWHNHEPLPHVSLNE